MYDRHLEHSTIIYEEANHTPLLRLAWNKQDPNYLSTFALDSMEVKNDVNYTTNKFYNHGRNLLLYHVMLTIS